MWKHLAEVYAWALRKLSGIVSAFPHAVRIDESAKPKSELWRASFQRCCRCFLRPVHTEGICDSGKPLAFFRKANAERGVKS